MKLNTLIVFLVFMAIASQVWANTGDVAVFNSVYPNSRSFTNYNCAICHNNIAANTNLTSYGSNYKAMGRNQATSFAGIEMLDSDADGYNNLQEITAGSNPGDLMSNPNNVPAIIDGGGGSAGGSGGGQNRALQSNDFDLKNSNMLAKTSCASVSNLEKRNSSVPLDNILILFFLFMSPILSVAFLKSQLRLLNSLTF